MTYEGEFFFACVFPYPASIIKTMMIERLISRDIDERVDGEDRFVDTWVVCAHDDMVGKAEKHVRRDDLVGGGVVRGGIVFVLGEGRLRCGIVGWGRNIVDFAQHGTVTCEEALQGVCNGRLHLSL